MKIIKKEILTIMGETLPCYPGGTPLFGLYGDVPLDRVWFFGLAVLNRVYNLACLHPKQEPVLNRVWYYEPRDLNSECEHGLMVFVLFKWRDATTGF